MAIENSLLNGGHPQGVAASALASDPFEDLEQLRVSQDFGASLGLKKLRLTVPVRKPDRQWFVRVHPDEGWHLQTALLNLKDAGKPTWSIDLCGRSWQAMWSRPCSSPASTATTSSSSGPFGSRRTGGRMNGTVRRWRRRKWHGRGGCASRPTWPWGPTTCSRPRQTSLNPSGPMGRSATCSASPSRTASSDPSTTRCCSNSEERHRHASRVGRVSRGVVGGF